jgi:HAD superfamily hydrolase (TIGR01549 family)
MGIEIVSFDVDGTLVDPDFNDLIWQRVIPELVAKKENIDFNTALQRVQREYDIVGEKDNKWYDIKYWIKFFQLDVNYKELLEKYENEIKIFPETCQVLEKLTNNYKLICISSMPREFLQPKVKKIEKFFYSTFSALSDYQQLKNREVYQKICQKINVPPERVLHIGDSEKSDYIASKEAGLNALLIDRHRKGYYQRYPEEVIINLSDIITKIKLL